jgi:transmembrane sensor
METNPTYYTDLISRYLYGEATPEEICELESWVKADPANREMFSGYLATWKTVENARLESSFDLDREWNVLKSKIVNRKSQIIYLALRIAAIFLLVAIPAFFLYRYFAQPSDRQLVAGNEVAVHTLPDGTSVTLNAGATLTCPSRFDGSSRNVTLQGEAWFEVAHDKSKPFIIAAGNVRIQVVGTSFFVNTKTFSKTREIILATGKVRVYYDDNPAKMAVLFPGDKAELTSGGYGITVARNEDQNYLAWKTKYMVFNNTPLNEVVALLTQVYHTPIRIIGNGLGDCRITATFDKQSLESVLNVLKATLDLQVRNTGAGIGLSGHKCN